MKFMSLIFLLCLFAACATSRVERKTASQDIAESICEKSIVYKKSEVQKCVVRAGQTEKSFFLFKGRGSSSEIQFAHGYLLAEEIEQGSIEEMKGHFAREEAKMGKNKWLFNALKSCQMNRLKKSVSSEFMANISAVTNGYIAGMKAKGLEAKYNEEDFIFTLLGIEFGNVMGGISFQSDQSAIKSLTKVVGQCGLKLASAGLKEIIQNIRKEPAHDKKMGCVGLIAPDSATGNGLLHGRNLDQGPLMKSWAKAPVLYLIHEDDKIPYVAPGTAGLIYPGGISGFNSHGISVSLHQMNTTTWDTKHRPGTAEVVPYLQQKVLREAKSINEAFDLIKKTNTFSSWTIFISDSKTNEAASIEVSANRKVIARRTKNEILGQSNHYIDPSMQKEHFHYNFAAYLETQSRLHQMEKILTESSGKIDIDWALSALSSHVDFFEGERSFGRTAVKLSNIMSSVAHASRNEFWMTVGDRQPAAHSWFIGSKADFKAHTLEVFSVSRGGNFDKRASLEDSYSAVVSALLAYKIHDHEKTISELQRARKLALEDGVDDTAYTYNLARVYMMEEKWDEARGLMEKLQIRKAEFHPYHQALIAMYTARMRQLTNAAEKTDKLYTFAKNVLGQIARESKSHKEIKLPDPSTPEFEEARYKHGLPDLEKKLELIGKWENGEEGKIQSLDFGVSD